MRATSLTRTMRAVGIGAHDDVAELLRGLQAALARARRR